MLYTPTHPVQQGDRIRLFPTIDAARAVAQDGRPVLGVAVQFDAPCRRVTPLWVDAQIFDPAWSTPAEYHYDGSVTARGPIPEPLFAG